VSETKATAVREHAAQHSIDLARSIAYGDDESDLPLLRTTGRAVVVGGDPVLLGWAANRRGSVEVLDAERVSVVSSEVGQ
jgi:phosphoserine phosphatase